MVYKKNKEMDYIPVDETSLTVFDPETGDAHFFDATGIDILNVLDEPRDLETLVEKLFGLYDEEPDVIRADVAEFLSDAVSKKVVIEL